jgi:hypothetical protein
MAYGGKKLYDHMHPGQEEAPKQANEDMAAGDLGGADPGALERAMLFLRGLKNKIPGLRPSPEAQVAAGGLGQAGEGGLEVMAHVLDTVKTAADADDIIAQILHHQGEAGELASPELVEAIQQMMAQDESGEGMPEGMGDKQAALSDISNFAKTLKNRKKFIEDVGEEVGRASSNRLLKQYGAGAAKTVGKGLAGASAAGAALYGGKKLYDKVKSKSEGESKAASLLAQLKRAADGSLTDSAENTPESAAQDEQVAQLDQQNRSTNEYLLGVGKTKLPNKGQILHVSPAPKHDAVATDTVPSNETKNAEDQAYVQSFRKIAAEFGGALPANMPKEEKIAHLQAMLGVPPSERLSYIRALRSA